MVGTMVGCRPGQSWHIYSFSFEPRFSQDLSGEFERPAAHTSTMLCHLRHTRCGGSMRAQQQDFISWLGCVASLPMPGVEVPIKGNSGPGS